MTTKEIFHSTVGEILAITNSEPTRARAMMSESDQLLFQLEDLNLKAITYVPGNLGSSILDFVWRCNLNVIDGHGNIITRGTYRLRVQRAIDLIFDCQATILEHSDEAESNE